MDILFTCRHCNEGFIVNEGEFNCRILRHGVFKDTMLQINPHLPREECERLFNEGLIIGCGKPLRIIGLDVEVCDYI